MAKTPEQLLDDASAWWSTEIIDIHPGKIAIRGYPIQELIGRVRFPDMIWLMLRGELPSREQGDLLEAAMVPGVDHGPHAPSIAIARMAVTCGLPVNGAMASAINVLDDIHGGPGQQCMELYREIDAAAGAAGDLVATATAVIRQRIDSGEKIVPGFDLVTHGYVIPLKERLFFVGREKTSMIMKTMMCFDLRPADGIRYTSSPQPSGGLTRGGLVGRVNEARTSSRRLGWATI